MMLLRWFLFCISVPFMLLVDIVASVRDNKLKSIYGRQLHEIEEVEGNLFDSTKKSSKNGKKHQVYDVDMSQIMNAYKKSSKGSSKKGSEENVKKQDGEKGVTKGTPKYKCGKLLNSQARSSSNSTLPLRKSKRSGKKVELNITIDCEEMGFYGPINLLAGVNKTTKVSSTSSSPVTSPVTTPVTSPATPSVNPRITTPVAPPAIPKSSLSTTKTKSSPSMEPSSAPSNPEVIVAMSKAEVVSPSEKIMSGFVATLLSFFIFGVSAYFYFAGMMFWRKKRKENNHALKFDEAKSIPDNSNDKILMIQTIDEIYSTANAEVVVPFETEDFPHLAKTPPSSFDDYEDTVSL